MTNNNKWYLIESESDEHGNTSKEKKYIEENEVHNLQLMTRKILSLKGSDNVNDLNKINKQKNENLITTVLEHLNVHSLRNYISTSPHLRFWNLLSSRIEIKQHFPNNQFKSFHKMFRFDRNRCRGGLLLHINEKILSKILSDHIMSITFEIIITEFHQQGISHKGKKFCVLYVLGNKT